DTIGHLRGPQIMQWLEKNRDLLEDAEILARIHDLHERTLAAAENGESYRAIELAKQRDRVLIDAYTQAHHSREGEFRAVWEHSGTGAYAEGWDKTMRVLSESGFNAIMPNTFWGGVAYHRSEILPVADIVEEKGDQVAQAVEAGKRWGIQVHPWKVNFRLARGTPEAFIERMRSEGRLQKTFGGEEQPWLCPSDPRNQELEIASMVEVATNYDVAGVHFDYIRYPGGNNCYCEGCRERFEADTGVEIENWPEDTRKEGIQEKWLQWRAAQITHIVAETGRRVHAARPECKVSAAVFRNYPNCLTGVGQDWVTWAKEGYVDFLCPMDYTNSDVAFGGQVITQLGQVDGAVPVYPGIGASSSSSTLSPDRVAGQIEIARHAGTDGFIIFNYTATLGDTVLPALGGGVTSEAAAVPHDGPEFDFDLTQTPDLLMRAVALDPGQTVAGTITRLRDEMLAFGDFNAEVLLETADGRMLQELGRISDEEPELDYDIALQESGIYRIAVRGTATSEALGTRPFTRRSMPVVVGSPPEDFGRFIPL
ncbi:MAG: glycoside hydrolase family 10 protein, partial [Armatimonadota bacterium]